VISEDRFRALLQSVQPGVPIGARPVDRVSTATAPVGRLKGCRVLVLGGPHDVSARVRDEVMAHGGRVAVNLTPTVSHLIAMGAADTGGRVAVTLSTADDPEPRALISVSDTGVGIPADELDRLFSRFFRASTATQNAIPGVGLGLTITKAIANAHHGVIRVASTVDDGTTFTLNLPAQPGHPGLS
jgi:histidine kinase/DNA gyrase B/HSP90-like ATPase